MNRKRYKKLSAFLIPGLLGLAVFFMLPLAITVFLSFQSTGELLFHYRQVVSSKAFQLALKNTLKLIATGIPMAVAGGVLMAIVFQLLFRNRLPGARFLFLMYLLPLVIPSAVVAFFVELFFPYSEAPQVGYLMTGIYIWKNVPYVLLAAFLGLRNIPAPVYDAAQLDGAGGSRMLRHILLPLLKPYILVGIVLAFLGVFRIFRESYLLFGNYPDRTVYYLQNYMNNLFYAANYSQLAAASDLFLVGLSILLLAALAALGKEAQR